jgi:hypothetical protein
VRVELVALCDAVPCRRLVLSGNRVALPSVISTYTALRYFGGQGDWYAGVLFGCAGGVGTWMRVRVRVHVCVDLCVAGNWTCATRP